jgi:hypothetical protein
MKAIRIKNHIFLSLPLQEDETIHLIVYKKDKKFSDYYVLPEGGSNA